MSIRTRHDNQDSISKALNKVPDRLHYGTNARTLDFVIEAKKGYSLVENRMQKIKGGTHGNDARVKDVHAIFYAKGPDFKTNKTVKAFRNVSVYNLIAHILGLEIEVVDGNFIEIKDMLKD
jgi:alkaline phosphatase D